MVAFALGVYAVIIIYHTSPTVSNQNERIYLHTPPYSDVREGYVKLSDMKPGDFGYFMYPSSYNYSDKWNAYQKFILIRLPSWLGGDKNDTSSFRAYSQLDIASHCILVYGRFNTQNIEDVCWFEKYRIIDGAASTQPLKVLVKPIYNALPQLDLAIDNDGYLSVKPPTWTANMNGVIGDGRILSADDIRKSSEILLQGYKEAYGINLNIPLKLQTREFLLLISNSGGTTKVQYQNLETWNGTAKLSLEFCNCSSSSLETRYNEDHLIQVDGIPMVSYGAGQQDTKTGEYQGYQVSFIKNGYKITLTESKLLHVITGEILNDFFNGTNHSVNQKSG